MESVINHAVGNLTHTRQLQNILSIRASASMIEELVFTFSTFGAIFAIVNPIGAASFFVVLTKDYPSDLKVRVVKRAVVAASATLVIFGLLGNYIFLIFRTSIPAFQIAGGFLLFTIGFSMVQGERPKSQLTLQDREEALHKEVVGIVPIGIPMLAGPGAITTVLVLMAEAANPSVNLLKVAGILLSIALTMIITGGILRYSDRLFKRMGRMGIYAFTRIMGLLLTAVAVQIIILGIRAAQNFYFS